MKLPITRKIERAFAVDYLPSALSIDGLNIYEAHERADEIEFPALVVYGENSTPHPDMPTATGIRVVNLRCQFTVDSETTTRATLDAWREELEAAMGDLAQIQAALNEPTIGTGTDERQIDDIHIHDAVTGEQPSDRQNTDWVEDCSFDITVEPL
jgi:hypothetical protein